MPFKNELELRVVGKQRYQLATPLIYERSEGDGFKVHAGFKFDGASIPRPLWGIVGSPLAGGFQRSACLHDALYASQTLSRFQSDQLFLEAMNSEGVGMKRYWIYGAVRLFGGRAWRKNFKALKDVITPINSPLKGY